jgi:carbon storage regulator
MLVLSRKELERIRIGDEVEIIVTKIKGNTVRIGIEAPKHIRVVRDDAKHRGDSDPMSGDEPETIKRE